MGAVDDSGDYAKALDAALAAADWEKLKKERDAARKEGAVGLGLSDVRRDLRNRTLVNAPDWRVGGTPRSRSSATAGFQARRPARHRMDKATRRPSPRCWPTSSGYHTHHIRTPSWRTPPWSDSKALAPSVADPRRSGAPPSIWLARRSKTRTWRSSRGPLLEAHEEDLVFENGMIGVKGVPGSRKPFREVALLRPRPGSASAGFEPGLSDEALLRTAQQHLPLWLSHFDGGDRS